MMVRSRSAGCVMNERVPVQAEHKELASRQCDRIDDNRSLVSFKVNATMHFNCKSVSGNPQVGPLIFDRDEEAGLPQLFMPHDTFRLVWLFLPPERPVFAQN